MNSSFLLWGQVLLAVLAGALSFLLLLQFGLPRDTIRVLGVGYFLTLFLMLLTDVLTWWGFSVVFHYPEIYAVFMGLMGFTWPSFLWLALLESPTQLQRKIMWRLPLVGALLGHALGTTVGIGIFFVGWLVGFVLIVYYAKQQRYILRTAVALFVTYFCYIFVREKSLLVAQLFFAAWIVLMHKTVNALLVKNHVRNALVR